MVTQKKNQNESNCLRKVENNVNETKVNGYKKKNKTKWKFKKDEDLNETKVDVWRNFFLYLISDRLTIDCN